MSENELKIDELRTEANAAEQTVLSKNIYYYATLDRLIDYEEVVNRIASEIGLKVEQLLADTGVKTPIQLLEMGIRHWDQKLDTMDVPSDEELVSYLSKQFQVEIHRVAAVLSPDESVPGTEERGRPSPETPDDANRVMLALKTILHSEINGSPIKLDDLKISISDVPPKSSRKKAYWIIDIKKLKIAVLLDNQAKNRTFVVTYNSPDELEKLGTKITLKTRAEKGEVIHHFKYYNEAQFMEDLSNAILMAVEKKGIKKMDEPYFRNAENVRKDFQAFVDDLISKNHKIVKKIEDLSTFSLAKAVAVCANGEERKGETYLIQAGVQLKMATNTNDARTKQGAIFEALKKIIGIEVVKFPKMDEKYFENVENVQYDLRAYVEELQKDPKYNGRVLTIDDLNILNLYKLTVKCKNGETVSGHAYLQRAGIGLKMAEKASQSDGKLGDILIALKRKAGIEVISFPKMDEKYFGDSKNVRKDLDAFVAVLQAKGRNDIKTFRDLTTYTVRGVEIIAANGELVKGQNYMARASAALGLNKAGGRRPRVQPGAALKQLMQKVEESGTAAT